MVNLRPTLIGRSFSAEKQPTASRIPHAWISDHQRQRTPLRPSLWRRKVSHNPRLFLRPSTSFLGFRGTPACPNRPHDPTRAPLTTSPHSKVPHYHGAPHLDGHDGILPNPYATACASSPEHDEVRSDRYVPPHAPRNIRLVDRRRVPRIHCANGSRDVRGRMAADEQQCGNRSSSWSRSVERNSAPSFHHARTHARKDIPSHTPRTHTSTNYRPILRGGIEELESRRGG